MKRFVYLAGPYSSPNPIDNTRTAFALAERLATECDVDVFVPHGSLLQDLVTPRPYEDWMAWDFNIISRCDALYRMDGDSPGADREVEFADMHNIPVFFDIDDLNEWLS